MYKLTKPQKLIYDMERFAGGSIAVICGSAVFEGEKELSALKKAACDIVRLNAALRLRMLETEHGVMQRFEDYTEPHINVLRFENKDEFTEYANEYAKTPVPLFGQLCELSVVLFPGHYGILAKLHHLVGDAWTLSLIATQFYALANGATLEETSYADYISAEASYIDSARYERDRDFFLDQFRRCDEVIYISEKQTDSFLSRRRTFVIEPVRAEKIKAYVKDKGTSAFVLFMTALAAYISRTKMNAEKFYIGTAVLNRSNAREKRTMGMFVNTVPMLIELDSGTSFAENLDSVQKSSFFILRHQKYNYGDVLADIRREYGFTDRLYDVMLSYQNATISADGKIESTWYHSGAQAESLQIHIDDRDGEGIFRIHYDYQVEKFTERDIDRLHEHICTLLFGAIENDGKELRELALLTDDERRQLLVGFNDTAVNYPKDKCVYDYFVEQVNNAPDRPAVLFKNVSLTYMQLYKLVESYAAKLKYIGISTSDVVAVHIERSHKIIALQLAVIKIGAILLPVDKRYPTERIEFMCSDCNIKLLITDEKISLSNKSLHVLDFEKIAALGSVPTIENHGVCYIIYTSGSTGIPKGCMLTSDGLVNFCKQNNTLDSLQRNDQNIFACVNSASFDYFIAESLFPLLNGYAAVVLDDAESTSQELFLQSVEQKNINVLMTTPTRLKLFFSDRNNRTALARLNCICTSGEPLTPELLAVMYECSPKADIFNPLGPSECTVWDVGGKLDREAGLDIHIGRPIANTQIYIVDKYMQPVSIGVTGELCIAGDGVGAGYLNRPELTAEKFIDNPFGAGKLYKTGDLAYWREDGNIAYVGRNDFQVKIRGLRIELGEIESAMSALDGISQAVVVVRKNDKGRQIICAFYTGAELPAQEIRGAVGQTLPKYMIPHIFTHIDEMPLTASGKINRNALPEVDFSQIQREYEAPQTETEKTLCAIVAETLRLERVGRTDDFFDLGGDSLYAISMLHDIETAFGKRLETAMIVRHPVMCELAAVIDVSDSIAETIPVLHKTAYPILPQQMGIYTTVAAGDSLAYNMPMKVELPEGIDLDRLKQAFLTLFDNRHELRTRFVPSDGGICGEYDPAARLTFEEVISGAEFVRPFELAQAPLMRVGFRGRTLYLDMHHILSDGETVHILLRELSRLYDGETVVPGDIMFGDYAHFFAEKLRSGGFDGAISFYRAALSGEWEPVTLPERQREKSGRGETRVYPIDGRVFENAKKTARTLGVTDTALCLALYGLLLSKFSGQEDILSSVVLTNREHAQLSDAVGMFANTMPIFLHTGGGTLAEYAKAVNDTLMGMYKHQELPFLTAADALGVENKAVVNTAFVYQAQGEIALRLGRQAICPERIGTHTAKFDVTFELTPTDGGAELQIEYDAGKYDASLIDRMADGYARLLSKAEAEAELVMMSALSDDERQKLLYDFNDTAVNYPRDKCVHTLLEEQAARTPDKTAVIACDRTLTYRELNEQANRIAHALMERGIRGGDIVAFSLSRKSYLIPAIFGILKAGAAYLPLDLDYPQERVEYILRDSKARLYITDDSIPELLENDDINNPTMSISADDFCYCIYTSGTTGTPKGVLICHRNLVNFCGVNRYNAYQQSAIVHNSVLLSTAKCCFDAFGCDYALFLLSGKTMVLAADDELVSSTRLAALIRANQVNVIQTTPSVIHTLCEDSEYVLSLKQLKTIIIAAEEFRPELYHFLMDKTDAKIFNGYGPSETTIGASLGLLSSEDIHIGKPIANTQIYIVDKYMQPVPIGVTGELCIAGDGVGAGYLNRMELTAEKFIDNPFGAGKLYKTGDLAYWREDGNIAYVGRNDFQVKIRGLRIELGEIESAMSGIDGISQAVVVVRKNDEGRQIICAFYTGMELPPQEVRSAIGKRLPKYMVPHIFTHIDEMPLTASGKIDRQKLPEVDLNSVASGVEYIAPVTELQKLLCALAEEVLGVSPVGLADGFVDLGGDSLKAIEFVSKAHHAGIYFSLQGMFDSPTMKDLAEYIENGDRAAFSFDGMDFTAADRSLAKNRIEYITMPPETDVGNILLAGATGFLGAHILADYLDNDNGVAYCLVRGKDEADSEKRLADRMRFYFGDKYAASPRIRVICADLEKLRFGLDEEIYDMLLFNVSTVINAAASVKHYGSYQYFYQANVETVKRLIAFCMDSGARLVHTSTLSVSGNGFGDEFSGYVSATEKYFYEYDLYIGQALENVYARSKFEAEKAVLDAMNEGLSANIMRMGNLTNRLSDGVFQPNYETNAFLKRVKAVLDLGMFPDYLMRDGMYAEFTPIDEAAHAIMTITRHFSAEQTVFHINSPSVIYMEDLHRYFSELGFPFKVVDGETFTMALRDKESIYETFINDMDEHDRLNYESHIHIENEFTVQYLRGLGFDWSELGLEYMRRYVAWFRRIGYWG